LGALLLVAGFQVSISGRFWVSTEVSASHVLCPSASAVFRRSRAGVPRRLSVVPVRSFRLFAGIRWHSRALGGGGYRALCRASFRGHLLSPPATPALARRTRRMCRPRPLNTKPPAAPTPAVFLR